jgi:GNAT superfamily N-acetyltransferase
MNTHTCSVLEEIEIAGGRAADYHGLARFHYRAGRPRGVKRVLVAWHAPAGASSAHKTMAGVLVEGLPPLSGLLRRLALPGRFDERNVRARADRLNREMRTILRVVVHPQFRGIGLGVRLVRRALETAQTPYVEAFAAMGEVHPLFARAGMREYRRPPGAECVRLLAALEWAGLTPAQLIAGAPAEVSEMIRTELRRFARHKEAGIDGWLAEARERLMCAPVYYLWQRGAVLDGERCEAISHT